MLETEEPGDPVLADALWTAAVIAYAHCFKDGKRRFRPQPADIAALPLEGEVLEFHELILNLRGKHIAHSANPFEQVAIGAFLSPPDASSRQVEGISFLSARLVAHDPIGVRQLGNLAHAMAQAIKATIDKKQEALLAELQQFDVDDLYQLLPARIEVPGHDAARRARS